MDRLLAFFRTGDEREAPRTGEFRAIAKVLNRPLAVFFLPAPPPSADRDVSFRHPVERPSDEPLLSNEQNALRSVSRWQRTVTWIRESSREPFPEVPSIDPGASAVAVAGVLHRWLTWDTDEQKKLASASALLRLARRRLEEHGIIVLQFSLGPNACKGFSVPHRVAPAVALNTAYNPAARVYTIFHELAHLVRGDRAVCGTRTSDSTERWCEQVAAAVLMPAADLREYTSSWLIDKADDISSVRRVANHYNVSLRAAAIQLQQIGKAADGLYALVRRQTELAERRPMRNTEPQIRAVRRIRELGNEIPRLLLRAQEDRTLSETELLRYLKVDRSELFEIYQRVNSASSEV
jgi:Zn-dependent peptidase ImmA (M78 family)